MNVKKAVVGVDHGGFTLKDRVVAHLKKSGIAVTDLGVFTEESVDYTDIATEVCTTLIKEDYDLAVLACGTGIGVSMAANKIAGVRCALVHDLFTAEMAAAHNHANALAFGGRVSYSVPVESMLDTFFDTAPLGDRHDRRVRKLDGLIPNKT